MLEKSTLFRRAFKYLARPLFLLLGDTDPNHVAFKGSGGR
jgi:hypothetical protein